MQLNLPILHLLDHCQTILIAGAGGGFDVFAGLPLYFTLRDAGKTVHLANFSFTEFSIAKLIDTPHLLVDGLVIGARGQIRRPFPYYPEGYLAEWFREMHDENVTVWMFPRGGVVPLIAGYEALLAHLGGVDAILLVDGGVDSIMRGDEMGAGTLLEDTLSLAAVDALPVKVKLLACIGFGTEVEEAVCHYNALENMANLAREGAFYGACALTPQMPAFTFYKEACLYVWDKPDHHKSHISTRIIPAVHGLFGDVDIYATSTTPVLLSPLMSLYWFFNATSVVRRSLIAPIVRPTLTMDEAFRLTAEKRTQFTTRPRRVLPY